MAYRKQVSIEQFERMVAFMEEHSDLARGKLRYSPEYRASAEKLWKLAAKRVNSVEGTSYRNYKEWQKWFADKKCRVLAKARDPKAGFLTPLEVRLYNVLGGPDGTADQVNQKRSKKDKSHFRYVRKNCLDLVRRHGRPLELFDDDAFKNILKVVPMTQEERLMLTAKCLEQLLQRQGDSDEDASDADEDEEADETRDDEEDMEDDRESNSEDGDISSKFAVKREKGCTCPHGTTSGGRQRHDVSCAAAAEKPFWNWFDMNTDEAICSICNQEVKWNNMSELKSHLLELHPECEFNDDEAYIEKVPVESKQSTKKPKTKSMDNTDESDIFKKRQSSETRGKKRRLSDSIDNKDSLAPEVKLINSETIPLSKFACLDRFGLYVAALMRSLPRDKCNRYQEQIIQKLLREQPAAA